MSNAACWVHIKWTVIILLFMIIDIGPIPFTASICLYIVWFRPQWFKDVVEKVYR